MNVSDQGDLRNGYSSNFPDDRCRQEWKHFQNCEKGPAIVLIIIIIVGMIVILGIIVLLRIMIMMIVMLMK